RRRAGQRILPGEPGPEGALVHVEIKVDRVLAEQRDEDAERDQCRRQRKRGDDDVFRRAADPLGECRAQPSSRFSGFAQRKIKRGNGLGLLPAPLWEGGRSYGASGVSQTPPPPPPPPPPPGRRAPPAWRGRMRTRGGPGLRGEGNRPDVWRH